MFFFLKFRIGFIQISSFKMNIIISSINLQHKINFSLKISN